MNRFQRDSVPFSNPPPLDSHESLRHSPPLPDPALPNHHRHGNDRDRNGPSSDRDCSHHRDRPCRTFWLSIVTMGIALSTAIAGQLTHAITPAQIYVDNITGNTSELRIRRNGRGEPVGEGSILLRDRDDLLTIPPNNAYSMLRFRSDTGDDLGLFITTEPHAEQAIYYFPCRIQGGSSLIRWDLAGNSTPPPDFGLGYLANEGRGCERGLELVRRTSASAQDTSGLPLYTSLNPTLLAQSNSPQSNPQSNIPQSNPQSNRHYHDPRIIPQKQLAQVATTQLFYCNTISADDRMFFATSQSRNSCTKALDRCQTPDNTACEVAHMGSWWTSEEQLHASLECVDQPLMSVDGTGDTIESHVQALIQQAQGQSCNLRIHRPQDFVITPVPDDVVLGLGDDETLVRTQETSTGLEVIVLKGAINVRSTDSNGVQLLTKGDRYLHSEMGTGQVTTFDRDAAFASTGMEVLCTYAANPEKNVKVSACDEAGLNLYDEAGTLIQPAKCNQIQGSGGSEIERRMMQMNANNGEIELEYDTFVVPDQFELFYEGRLLYNTGFVSGSNRISIPFSGQSSRLELMITGNARDTTEWNYTLYCP